jgi:hypothetical protein
MIGRVCIVVAVALLACGDGTSPLAKGEGGGGADASGGAGGVPSTSTTTTSGVGGSGGIEEPPGPTKLTIVAGVVDAAAIRVCFVADGAPSPTPFPGPEGLPYARSAVANPPEGEVEMFVLAGDLGATGGKSCGELVTTPPPGVVARSVGIFPDGVFSAERSILLVPNGCVGGDGHTDPLAASICGAGYDPAFGNVSVLAGFMSRIVQLDKVALQFAQASAAMAPYDLRVKSAQLAPAQLVVAKWSVGAIAPFPPYMALSEQTLLSPDEARVGVYEGAQNPIFEVPWSVAFGNGPLTAADVKNGRGLVFVAMGPAPTVNAGPWWNPHTYTVLLADP